MEIQEYSSGEEVRQYDETIEGFRTGLVCARYYDPDIMEINGEAIEIKIISDSPVCSVGDSKTDTVIVIDQTKVTLHYTNE